MASIAATPSVVTQDRTFELNITGVATAWTVGQTPITDTIGAITEQTVIDGLNLRIRGKVQTNVASFVITDSLTSGNPTATITVQTKAVADAAKMPVKRSYKLNSAGTTNATSVKATPGTVLNFFFSNINAAARYVKFYDKASAPTVGTDTPIHTFLVPGNTAGAGAAREFPQGLAFALGIAFAITAVGTDADTTVVAANEIIVNLDYI